MRVLLWGGIVVLGLGLGLGYAATTGLLGERQARGEIVRVRRDEGQIAERARTRSAALQTLDAPEAEVGRDAKQILFGDLHVHTTFSFDAYSISLPMAGGEGSHPPADACDFARFCSGLDFWSINDHAEGLTPHQWDETRRAVRECNAVAGDPGNPDLVTYLGWEWTQIGTTPENHYGHKNVVLRDTADEQVPARPIASRLQLFPGADPYGLGMRLLLVAAAPGGGGRQPYLDFMRFLQDRKDVPVCPATGSDVRGLPEHCLEAAATPGELFGKLDDWGFPYLVIPHGNTWGFYTPPLSSWDKQLRAHREPERHEPLIEVFSGHGNIEPYRSWRALEVDADGVAGCPSPVPGYTSECWRAGEIIEARCAAEGESAAECARRATTARANHVAAGASGHLTVPGARVEDWLDAGQCTDCYMPAYNYRPGGSVQYALALRDFDAAGAPKRFRFGLLGSSDVHTARPGTGYKEIERRRFSDTLLGNLGPPAFLTDAEPEARSVPREPGALDLPYFERFASFFGLGGLVAVHSAGRDRDSIWTALQAREVYATSGDRILLWFDLQAPEGAIPSPMGSSVRRSSGAPTFRVRAVGALEQQPGCPGDVAGSVSPERLDRLCGGECYHPGDRRRRIDRIEVVRIRPQVRPDEPIEDLIEDPWRVIPCPADTGGCSVRFRDTEFEAVARDSVYYVRAIQEPTPTVNGTNLRCDRDPAGRCVDVAPCGARADQTAPGDDCLTSVAERAWSSPIFIDFGD